VAARSYTRFARLFGLRPTPPIGEFELCAWVTHLADSSPPLRYTTIRTYLSSLAAVHRDAGLADPVASSERVWQVWRGVKRIQGANSGRPRLPIFPRTLGLIFPLLNLSFPDDCAFWALCCTATYGLFRLGELTISSLAEPPLRISNLCWFQTACGGGFSIRLEHSKTDPWRKGVEVKVVHPVAVSAMMAYLGLRSSAAVDEPLFAWADRRAVSRATFIPLLRKRLRLAGINDSLYAGHSFRKGGPPHLPKPAPPIL